MEENEIEDGRTATLIVPFKGYRNIQLIRKIEYKWLIRICGSGLEMPVYEDEFELD